MRQLLFAALAAVALFAVSCNANAPPDGRPPGELMAGIGRVRQPAPVGIGTVGFGSIGAPTNPTPFAEIYPGTQHLHGAPEFKAVVLSRGPGRELVFLRSDTVGIFQQFRRAVVQELGRRMGRDFEDVVIMGGTHTHSGPGRVIQAGGPFNIIADTFFPEFYQHMVDSMVDAVQMAYADLRPAEIGHTIAYDGDDHHDRRCEDGGPDYQNPTAPVLVVKRDDQIDALIYSYAIHGTVLSIDDLTLSQDVSGAMEEAVENRFDHPVMALQFNSWAADMSPGGPPVMPTGGSPEPDGYAKMEAIGADFADHMDEALQDITWSQDPTLDMRTYRVPIDREHIGYADDVFPYEYGGVFCGSSDPADCDASTVETGIDHQCVAFNNDFPAPTKTYLSVGTVGDWSFVTWPGECGTKLAEDTLGRIEQDNGLQDVMFFGYAQDYLGYSLEEDDWWQGGYEASGALWGPKQGEYLRDRLVEVAGLYEAGQGKRPEDEMDYIPTFDVGDYTPREATPPVDEGTIVINVQPTVSPNEVVSFTIFGQDPWAGTPIAHLQTQDGTVVRRADQEVFDSDGYGFWIDLATDPTYREAMDTPQRAFFWTFNMPVSHATSSFPTLLGSYRVVVDLPDGSQVKSGRFSIQSD